MESLAAVTAADLRAARARVGVPWYRVASAAGLHPARLSPYINEHLPLPAELAARVLAAIEAARRR